MAFGKSASLSITGYKDKNYKSKIDELTFPFNPNSLKMDLSNDYSFVKGLNQISGNLKFLRGQTTCLKVTLIIDSTLAVDFVDFVDGAFSGITDKLDNFLKLAYTMNDSTHESNYLVVKWGAMKFGDSKSGFRCRLKELKLDHKLFANDGTPLRSEAKCTFVESLSDSARASKVKKNSPDLTHVRQVKQGDTLPKLVFDIYGHTRYLMAVASANNLNHFRALQVGQTLIFPPVSST